MDIKRTVKRNRTTVPKDNQDVKRNHGDTLHRTVKDISETKVMFRLWWECLNDTPKLPYYLDFREVKKFSHCD